MTSTNDFWLFWKRAVLRAPRHLVRSWERAETRLGLISSLVLSVGLFVQPTFAGLDQWDWELVSRWWSLLPLAAMAILAVMYSAYEAKLPSVEDMLRDMKEVYVGDSPAAEWLLDLRPMFASGMTAPALGDYIGRKMGVYIDIGISRSLLGALAARGILRHEHRSDMPLDYKSAWILTEIGQQLVRELSATKPSPKATGLFLRRTA